MHISNFVVYYKSFVTNRCVEKYFNIYTLFSTFNQVAKESHSSVKKSDKAVVKGRTGGKKSTIIRYIFLSINIFSLRN